MWHRASLAAQWLRICLPMQGTRVRALVREDPTCRGATKPVRHNYWACALEPVSHNYWARVSQILKPVRLEPVLHNKRSHRDEKPAHCNEEYPRLATTRESLRAATMTQCSQKKKKKEKMWHIKGLDPLLLALKMKQGGHGPNHVTMWVDAGSREEMTASKKTEISAWNSILPTPWMSKDPPEGYPALPKPRC